jgi:hypothetical protein
MKMRAKSLGVAGIGSCAAVLTWASMAWAMTVPKIEHAATLKECGACHMVYSPQLLPQRSWDAIMSHLDDHFGEVATLDEPTRLDVLSYLLANAIDAPGSKAGDRLLRGVRPDEVPQRVTDLPWFKRRHGEVNFTNIKSTPVKSASNCIGCHKTADKGEFYE